MTRGFHSVTLPQLGESVESGTIVAWLVAEGDDIEVDQSLVEVSTDKVDTEIPSPVRGRVVRLLVDVDAEVQVGQPILEVAGERTGAVDGPADAGSQARESLHTETPPTAPEADPTPADGSGADVSRAPRLSPLVKRLLREHDLDPGDLTGTGRDHRITPQDVRTAATARTAGRGGAAASQRGAPPSTELPTAKDREAGPSTTRTEPLSRVRSTIASRMMASLHGSAQLTAAVEADVTHIMQVRAETKAQAIARSGFAPSPLAFIARALCWSLAAHPVINASIDTDQGTVTYHRDVHLGVAVDTPAGLLVPVVRDAQDLTVMALQERINGLASRARDGRFAPGDLAGGTFTVTNTGTGGTLFDTPIVNAPEAAILATPRIEKRPVVVTDAAGSDTIAIRQRLYLCLSYDHQLIDGADAARFLTHLARMLETADWRLELGAST